MAASPEDLINQALRAIGHPRRIATIWEGSAPTLAALDIYAQTRDELLRAQDWPFARRTAPLALLKGPPPPGGYSPATPWSTAYPPPGYLYEYGYPADCLELRAIVRAFAMPVLDPRPERFTEWNDSAFAPPQKVILANCAGALGVYRAQVTDPTTWEPGFSATFIAALADKLRRALGPDPAQEREAAMSETVAAATAADRHRG